MSSTQTTPPADTATLAEQLDVLTDRLVVTSHYAQMREVGGVLRSVDRLLAAVVTALMANNASSVVAAEGMTTASWLRAVAGRSGADAGMLLAAAERLADMPAVAAWFADGTLSWSTVRGIVAATRNLTVAQRRWVDATLAADPGRMARLDADQAIAAATRLADAARPELQRERVQRSFDRQFLTLQPAFDGTGQMYAEMDAETTAIALQALNDLTGDYPDHDDSDGDEAQPVQSTASRGRSSLEAFKTLCLLRPNRKANRHDNGGGHADDGGGHGDNDSDAGSDHAAGDHDADCNHDPRNSDADDGPDDPDSASVDGDRNGTGDSDDSFTGDGDGSSGGDDRKDRSGGGRGDVVRWGAAPSTARPSLLVITDLALLSGSPDGGRLGHRPTVMAHRPRTRRTDRRRRPTPRLRRHPAPRPRRRRPSPRRRRHPPQSLRQPARSARSPRRRLPLSRLPTAHRRVRKPPHHTQSPRRTDGPGESGAAVYGPSPRNARRSLAGHLAARRVHDLQPPRRDPHLSAASRPTLSPDPPPTPRTTSKTGAHPRP